MKIINSVNADDYLSMIQNVAFKHIYKFSKFNYETHDLISELYIATKNTINYFTKNNKSGNLDGYIMLTMHNRIKALLILEYHKDNFETSIETAVVNNVEYDDYKQIYIENAVNHARQILSEIEIDILYFILEKPDYLSHKISVFKRQLRELFGITTEQYEGVINNLKPFVSDLVLNN
jgi:hypothetical protein